MAGISGTNGDNVSLVANLGLNLKLFTMFSTKNNKMRIRKILANTCYILTYSGTY
jgi:hypothetical protein